jgi:hypothetical protein
VETAVIKIGEVDKYTQGEYAHFRDASGKAWNCNKSEYVRNAQSDGKPIFTPGRKLKVAYNTAEPKDGRKYGAKWINEVAPAEDSDQITWPDREPYVPKGNGGFKNNGEFRTPEQIMRGQALEIAEGDIEKAKEFYAWILGDFKAPEEKVVERAIEVLDATVEDDDDIPFDPGSPF